MKAPLLLLACIQLVLAISDTTQWDSIVSLNAQILALFENPTEPMFLPKLEKKVLFDLPQNYYTNEFKDQAKDLKSQYMTDQMTIINVKNDTVLPDDSVMKDLMQISRRDMFVKLNPLHRQLANKLVHILMGKESSEEFIAVALYIRDRVNPYLFTYALSMAVMHRPDTKDVPIPPLTEIYPHNFIPSSILNTARQHASIFKDPMKRTPIEIPLNLTGTDRDLEHRVAYFREDIAYNLHHWHWHLVYPKEGDISIVDKDRRGELFYYVHQQIMARFNFERLSNKLPRTKPYVHLHEKMDQGYFSKLDNVIAGHVWPSRQDGSFLKDIDRADEKLKFNIVILEQSRNRIFEAIHRGRVETFTGVFLPLDEVHGIDILGNILQASDLSINKVLYGDFHNLGHIAIALCHDPDHSKLQPWGLMASDEVASRDPMFYRWHAAINDIFLEHKHLLPPYNETELGFPNVSITDVTVSTAHGEDNVIRTFWQKKEMDLSHGLDFLPTTGPVYASFTHLQHETFTYTIKIMNEDIYQKRGTVRIFLAPKFDERGRPWDFVEQKDFFIELDRFVIDLEAGENAITRHSNESTVTVPFTQTFNDLAKNYTPSEDPGFCKCGWPDHLLLPRGNEGGMPSQLFVMVSDYENDEVFDFEGNPVTVRPEDDQDEEVPIAKCKQSMAYCGLYDTFYPDRRAMGFPFDRLPRIIIAKPITDIGSFLTGNMFVTDITIKFKDTVVDSDVPIEDSSASEDECVPRSELLKVQRELQSCERSRGGPLLPERPLDTIDQTENKCNIKHRKTFAALKMTKLGGKYYYFLEDEKKRKQTWTSAQQFCQSHGLQLASIETEEENNLIVEYLKGKVSRGSSWIFWLSGSDSEHEGTWRWKSGQPFNFTDWGEGQPNNYREDADCLSLGVRRDGTTGWGDWACSERWRFVCELEDVCS